MCKLQSSSFTGVILDADVENNVETIAFLEDALEDAGYGKIVHHELAESLPSFPLSAGRSRCRTFEVVEQKKKIKVLKTNHRKWDWTPDFKRTDGRQNPPTSKGFQHDLW